MLDTTLRLRYPTGANLYAQIEGGAGVWNGTAYVAFANLDWTAYATPTPETPAGSGRYVCQFPTGSPPGNYSWSVYLRAGASAALGDVAIGQGDGYWDGTTFGGASSVTAGYGGAPLIHSGTAAGGAANQITLDSASSSVSGTYNGCRIVLSAGAGAGQSATISSYDGTGKVATIATTWATNPNNTTVFQILP